MPKQRITKEMIVEAAFGIARESGQDSVLVKEIAGRLNCSVQPIYSYCSSMEGLKKDLIIRVRQFVQDYVEEYIAMHGGANTNDFFKMTGHAYVQLAEAEPHIFQMFILHEREEIDSLDALYQAECHPDMAQHIAENLHIDICKARMLHRNMMIYNVGIGTILATASPGISVNEIYEQLDIAYQAFLRQGMEE
ncbi:MAG: TetR/AcrR family transcriptional regulator [Lachnospiraceae bacterium]|nr:TetR/AcrR family transcriptional regulator [Lachnospiraceae bacterium]